MCDHPPSEVTLLKLVEPWLKMVGRKLVKSGWPGASVPGPKPRMGRTIYSRAVLELNARAFKLNNRPNDITPLGCRRLMASFDRFDLPVAQTYAKSF